MRRGGGDTSSTPAKHQASAQPGVHAASSACSSPSAARCAALPVPLPICRTRDATLLLPLLASHLLRITSESLLDTCCYEDLLNAWDPHMVSFTQKVQC